MTQLRQVHSRTCLDNNANNDLELIFHVQSDQPIQSNSIFKDDCTKDHITKAELVESPFFLHWTRSAECIGGQHRGSETRDYSLLRTRVECSTFGVVVGPLTD